MWTAETGKRIMNGQRTQAEFHVNYTVVQTLHPSLAESTGRTQYSLPP